MTIANFNVSISETEALLKAMGLFKSKGTKCIDRDNVSQEFKNATQEEDYFNAYNIGLTNLDYDFLLKDDSFFQFNFTNGIRYAFFHSPKRFIPYKDFVFNTMNEDIDDDNNIFQEEYEQFLSSQQINLSGNTSIRFDFEINGYLPFVHPASHLHIGYKSQIRIPCDKIWTPLTFVIFSIKHTYYRDWKSLLESNNSSVLDAIKKIKTNTHQIPATYWTAAEQKDSYLT